MSGRFQDFLQPLKETHFALKDYVDFDKVIANVDSISIKLNQLNYLIGQHDMAEAVSKLWNENPKAFSVLDILIAVRSKDNKKAIDENGNVVSLTSYFESPQQVTEFLDNTGLTEVLQSKQIKNLVDYVFGIEVGLDSNARKNRGGHIMEKLVADAFKSNDIEFDQEVYSSDFPEIMKVLGTDKKRFDFVIKTSCKTYLIEVNFYSRGGSKPNEVARSYTEIGPRINSVSGFEFVWITDGIGWKSAKNKLEEAFAYIPSIYNLTTLHDFIRQIKE